MPYRLLDDASWALGHAGAPLFRSALTFVMRQALSSGIRQSNCVRGSRHRDN